MKDPGKFIIMKYRFSNFGELSRFMHDRSLSSRGISVQERMLSVRPIKIPLEPTAGKSIVRAVSFNCTLKGTKLISHLLWHAFFGKKFKVIHWQFLFELVDRATKWDSLAQVIFNVLMIINDTPRGGHLNQFNKNLRCVKASLADGQQLNSLLMMLESSGIHLPNKATAIEELCIINFNDKIVQRKPSDPARIGVGYKDKGTLGLPGQEYDPDQISPFKEGVSDNLFIKLMSNYRKENYIFR